ncbi:hypothetical protein ATY43_01450 [Xanthomonas oryzae pv. oryzae]|nr:hypothetical protein ATY43_01450 [Xanthomonas oryzae pv. oryzae]AOS09195.1 hypothetical protein ATY44_01425 [Xanthomonas oryzae pv. oryzae]AOS13377.1 hypothetical protein ATY45_01350 [Xanthomonas oryzae pv. oryzae]
MRLQHLTQGINAGHTAVVSKAHNRDAQLKALLKQGLVVAGFVKAVVGPPVGAVVADRIDL